MASCSKPKGRCNVEVQMSCLTADPNATATATAVLSHLNMHFPSLSCSPHANFAELKLPPSHWQYQNLIWIGVDLDRSRLLRLFYIFNIILLLLRAAHDVHYNVDACVHMVEISKTKRWAVRMILYDDSLWTLTKHIYVVSTTAECKATRATLELR